MGEAKRRQLGVQSQALEAMAVDTPGGRIHVQWDHGASATPNAQLTFFAEFLQATGVYDAWLSSCPLTYRSPNAPDKRDVLGTWLLAILAGHKRYAHITGLRNDAVSPQLLASAQGVLSTPWILDIDTTIKSLYGKQEGAQVSYNPHKPGRPSHALHTDWVGNLRLVLDVVVSPGKEHSAGKSRPALVRGDCGFGNEPFIAELESGGQPYLLKLRQTAGVKKLFARDD